jgi:hypothetical protein
MRANPVGYVFDQCGSQIAPCTLGRPAGHGMDGEIVVAVHPERGDTEAEATRGERA